MQNCPASPGFTQPAKDIIPAFQAMEGPVRLLIFSALRQAGGVVRAAHANHVLPMKHPAARPSYILSGALHPEPHHKQGRFESCRSTTDA